HRVRGDGDPGGGGDDRAPATEAEEKASSCSGPPASRRGAGSSGPPIHTEPRPWSSVVATRVVSSSHTGSIQGSSSGHTGWDWPVARSSSWAPAAREAVSVQVRYRPITARVPSGLNSPGPNSTSAVASRSRRGG